MSTSSYPTKSNMAATTSKGKVSSRKAKDSKAAPPPLKVVIRCLPHEMKEEEFLTALTGVAAEARLGERVDSWDLVYFAPGKMSKKRGRVTSTGYLQINRARGVSADLSLIKLRTAVLACEAMTGPAAKDATNRDGKAGEKSTDAGPTVLAAPFQKLFKQKPKRDVRVGTIEKDADFKAFCAALQSPPPPLPSADIQADTKESESKEEPKPQNALLDFLKERGAKKAKDGQRSAAVGSSARGSRRGTNASGGSSGSTSAATTSRAVVAPAPTLATKSKPPPPPQPSSSSSTADPSPAMTSKPLAKSKDAGKEPPNAPKSRSGGGSGGAGNGSSKSRASRGNSSGTRAAAPPAAKEHVSESASEAPIPLKEKGGIGSGAGGGGRRGGGGGKARASGKSTGSGSRSKSSGGNGSGSAT